MRTITSVTSALARRHCQPQKSQQQQRLIMTYRSRTNDGGMNSHRLAVVAPQTSVTLPPKFQSIYNNRIVRTFSIQPTMIKYMPIQTIDVRNWFHIFAFSRG